MSISIYQNPQSESAALGQSQLIDFQTHQMKLITEQRVPAERYLETVNKLESCIPSQDGAPQQIQTSYQNLLKEGRNLKVAVVEGDLAINKAETNFLGLINQLNSLMNMLENYKSASIQEKFNIEEYSVILKKIGDLDGSLQKSCQRIEELGNSLAENGLEDPSTITHFGVELSEEKVRRYFEIGKLEIESAQRYEMKRKDFIQKKSKFQKQSLVIELSTKATEELAERLTKYKDLLKEREMLIHEKKKEIENSNLKKDELRGDYADKFEATSQNSISEKRRQKENLIGLHNKKLEEIDNMISKLLQKKSELSMANPFLHIILVLDHSYSMKDKRWDELIKALDKFVNANKTSSQNLLSIIVFSDSAIEVMKKGKFSEYQVPKMSKWGGTKFDPAFELARDFSNLSRSHTPVVLFLTDGQGEGGMSKTQNILREMNTIHKDRGFMFFSIGVGDEYNLDVLQQLTRTANNGSLYADLGIDRIEFLHTTRNADVLVKVFVEISNAINTFPLKIENSISSLKNDKKKIEEEANHLCEVFDKMSEEERKEIHAKQDETLKKRIAVIETKAKEDEEQVKFWKAENEELLKTIKDLEKEVKEQRQKTSSGEFETLITEIDNLEKEMKDLSDEKEKLLNERKMIWSELEKTKKDMKFGTSLQSFDFFKAKDDLKSDRYAKRMYLGTMSNFIESIREEIGQFQKELENTNIKLERLEGDGALDIVFQYFKDSETVKIVPNEDIGNMLRIGYQILGLKDDKKKETLELLINFIPPRSLAHPTIQKEEHQKRIRDFLNRKFNFDAEAFEESLRILEDDCNNVSKKLATAQTNVKRLKEEIIELEDEQIPRKQKKLKGLKAENHSQKRNQSSKGNDTEYEIIENEDENNTAQELSVLVSRLEEKISSLAELRKYVASLEDRIEALEIKKLELKNDKTQKEREKGKIEDQILEYYDQLRSDFMAKIHKYLKNSGIEKITTFEQNIKFNLVKPLEKYFSFAGSDKSKIEDKELLGGA